MFFVSLTCNIFKKSTTKLLFLKSFKSTTTTVKTTMMKYLGQEEAIKIDEELFNDYKFSVDQLMELAGLSVATTITKLYENKKNSSILIICGPGNNGGDGFVAGRHLKLFGFENITILNSKKPTKELFINLIKQAELNDVRVKYDAMEFQNVESIGLIVDALFGFSFKPPIRSDSLPLMSILTKGYGHSIPIVSIDIPSGWDVENGPKDIDSNITFMPETLVSLTAPKLCANYFKGKYHFLGGRFVPKKLQEKYELNLPQYIGTDCIVRL